MSVRDRFENVVVMPENASEFPGYRIGDTVRIRHPATEVDQRLFAQLAESLGCPYPDETP